MSICQICGKKLEEAQYRENDRYKSCPRCSRSNGEEHIYYLYPEEFGTTPLRATKAHPDGPQSYCESCRGNSAPIHIGYKKCSEFRLLLE